MPTEEAPAAVADPVAELTEKVEELKVEEKEEVAEPRMGDTKVENLKPANLKQKTSPKACVIMVGSTNTGKSTTVNIMTKSKDCTVGEDTNAKPCTQNLHVVEDKDTGLIYMDNPGQLLPDILSKYTYFLHETF